MRKSASPGTARASHFLVLSCMLATSAELSCHRDTDDSRRGSSPAPLHGSESVTATKPAPAPKPRQAAPCSTRKLEVPEPRWVCDERGAPVDFVSDKDFILFVFHKPTRVAVVSPERGEAATIARTPEHTDRLVCSLDGSTRGLIGYVDQKKLHGRPCQ